MAEEFSVLTDLDGCLTAASDDARVILGRSEEEICAEPLFELFAEEDGPIVADALKGASNGKFDDVPAIRLRVGGAHQLRFDMTIEPSGEENFFLFFTLVPGEVTPVEPDTKEDFLSAVVARCGDTEEASDQILMIDFDGFRTPGLLEKIGEERLNALRTSIEGVLASKASDGQVGLLEDGTYGVLCAPGTEIEDTVAAAIAAAIEHGVDEEGLELRAENIALDATETDPDALNRQLSHVCNKFHQSVHNEVTFGLDRLDDVEAEIEEAVQIVEAALEQRDVTVSARQVWGLQSGSVSFWLAQGALLIDGESVPAERFLVLADHPKLCARHDRIVVEKAVETLPGPATVVVDIGQPTLASGEAVRIGAELSLQNHFIGFRPLGLNIAARRSPALREIDQLLNAGIIVWLVDFPAAIVKTRRIRGAYVEIGAALLQEISAEPDSSTLLSGLLSVWEELDLSLVATGLETRELASLANKLGIAYGVGAAADLSTATEGA